MKALKRLLESIQDKNRLVRAIKDGDLAAAKRALVGKSPQDMSMDPSKFRDVANAILNRKLDMAKDLLGISSMPTRGLDPDKYMKEPSTSGVNSNLPTVEEAFKKLANYLSSYSLVDDGSNMFDQYGEFGGAVIQDLSLPGNKVSMVINDIQNFLNAYKKKEIKTPSGKSVGYRGAVDSYYEQCKDGYIVLVNMVTTLRISLNSWQGGPDKFKLNDILNKYLPF